MADADREARCCATCRHRSAQGPRHGEGEYDCLRFPPQVVLHARRDPDAVLLGELKTLRSVFPVVEALDICGEYVWTPKEARRGEV